MPNQFDYTSLNRTVGWAWDGAIEGFQAVKFHRKSKSRRHFRELDRFFLAPKKVLLYHSPTVLALGSAKRSCGTLTCLSSGLAPKGSSPNICLRFGQSCEVEVASTGSGPASEAVRFGGSIHIEFMV